MVLPFVFGYNLPEQNKMGLQFPLGIMHVKIQTVDRFWSHRTGVLPFWSQPGLYDNIIVRNKYLVKLDIFLEESWTDIFQKVKK